MTKRASPSVTIVTSGHLSTCPRMVKAADALADDGYRVRVVSARFTPWATEADADILRRRAGRWRNDVVDYRRGVNGSSYLQSGIRFRAAGTVAALGPSRVPFAIACAARGRAHNELVAEVVSEPADIIYGSGSAIAAAAVAAGRLAVPYALDLEDFHGAEEDGITRRSRMMMALTRRIEKKVLPGAAFLTGGSEGIANAYERAYGTAVVPINNVFTPEIHAVSSRKDTARPLSLYWFSQTIGPGRGLEDAVRAAGLADVPLALHLRGVPAAGFTDVIAALQRRVAAKLSVEFHRPGAPDDMISLASAHDVGLALEQPKPYNHAICLANKVSVYMLAGLALALTNTEGQRPVIADLAESALAFQPGDIATFASGLRRWSDDRKLLGDARSVALAAGLRRWHWEHPAERGRLLELFARTLS